MKKHKIYLLAWSLIVIGLLVFLLSGVYPGAYSFWSPTFDIWYFLANNWSPMSLLPLGVGVGLLMRKFVPRLLASMNPEDKEYILPVSLVTLGFWMFWFSGGWWFPIALPLLCVGVVLLVRRSVSSYKSRTPQTNRLVSIIFGTVGAFLLTLLLFYLYTAFIKQ
jgi:hypothetical protein